MEKDQLELPFNEDWPVCTNRCDHLTPLYEPMLGRDHECLLHHKHSGEHLILNEGHGNWQFWGWEYEGPVDDVEDEAILFGRVDDAEALQRLADSPVLAQNSLTFYK